MADVATKGVQDTLIHPSHPISGNVQVVTGVESGPRVRNGGAVFGAARAPRGEDAPDAPPCSVMRDVFFDGSRDAEAKRVCQSCPMQAPCLELGRDELWGTWGGVSMMERTIAAYRAIPEASTRTRGFLPAAIVRLESAGYSELAIAKGFSSRGFRARFEWIVANKARAYGREATEEELFEARWREAEIIFDLYTKHGLNIAAFLFGVTPSGLRGMLKDLGLWK